MTRRLKLASMGLSAFLFPACMGTTAPTDPYYTGPGIKVLDRNPNGSGYSRTLPQPQPQPTPYSPIGPSVAAADPNSSLIVPPGSTVNAGATASLAPPASIPIPGQPAPSTITPVASVTPAASEIQLPPDVASPGKTDTTGNTNRGVYVPDEKHVPAWPRLGPQIEETATTPPGVLLKPEPVVSPPTIPPLSQSTGPREVIVPVDPRPAPHMAVSLKVPEPVVANPIPANPPAASFLPANSIAPAALASAGAETLLVRSIRAFQSNRPEEAAELLKQIDSSNQELLMYLMPTIVRLGEGNLNAMAPEELAMLVDRLQTASSMLKSKASLRADHVCFCRGVRKFADIEPYEPRYEFRPGEMVFLYTELRNFTCEPVTAQQRSGCVIRLATTLEIRDAKNALIWRSELFKNDFAQTPPQDYFHTYRFCVPEKIPAGVYTLWMTVTDKPTGRVTRKQVELRVGQS